MDKSAIHAHPEALSAAIDDLKEPRILLVEDCIVNQRVACRLLESMGCKVEVAEDGEEAVAMQAKSLFDLIFMDCQLPKLNGFDATSAIRQSEAGSVRRIPIVAMTANAMQGDKDECFAAGMDDFLPKPIDKEQLRRMVERHVCALC